MWPFRSVARLGKSGMLDGFTDWHSHILPGIDDGAKNFEMSMEMLQMAYDNKIRKLF